MSFDFSAVLTSFATIDENVVKKETESSTTVKTDERKTPQKDDFDFSFKPIELDTTSHFDDFHPITTFDEDISTNVDVDKSDLERKIIRQLEYYFGDYNLPKDRFMRDLMEVEDGKFQQQKIF